MIPMMISPEKYAHHFRPSPDVLIVQRFLVNYESIRNIHLPPNVRNEAIRFSTVGKVLAVSDLRSESEWIEYMKEAIRASGYIAYSFHVTVECGIIPQFEVPSNVSIIQVHVRDVTQVIHDFEGLLAEQAEYERLESQKTEESNVILQQERQNLILGANNGKSFTDKSTKTIIA